MISDELLSVGLVGIMFGTLSYNSIYERVNWLIMGYGVIYGVIGKGAK